MNAGDRGISRRTATRMLAAPLVAGIVAAGLTLSPSEAAETGLHPAVVPEEKVDRTIERLFGGRPIVRDAQRIKLTAPMIAENGAMVPFSVEVDHPMTPTAYVKHIYIIADQNIRPMVARFTLSPINGRAAVSTNIRLGRTTDVRAVVETSDGTLRQMAKEIKVTASGCGG